MLKNTIDELIEEVREGIKEIEEVTESDDFNPYDASGGNFDDAYQMGYDHGYEYGKLAILELIRKTL
jgi:hypothetical protein